MGPYFIKSWVPIGSLILSLEVPISFRHSAFPMEDEWEGKREVEALVVVEDAMEKEQMGIRRKNNWPRVWRKTILDDESGLKQTLPRALKVEDKQALWSVCTGQIKAPSTWPRTGIKY